MSDALGLVEIGGWSPAMVVLDAMEKNARVRVVQTELNDAPGVCLKFVGAVSDVHFAARAAEDAAAAMHVSARTHVIPRPSDGSRAAWEARAEVSPLIEQPVVNIPHRVSEPQHTATQPENRMSDQANFAVGLIETQGFTAAFEAVDTALKTAAVEVLAREKLGGGYITILIKGDVAAVRAAVEAGKAKVDGLGKLIAAHVIASPSQGVLALLPK